MNEQSIILGPAIDLGNLVEEAEVLNIETIENEFKLINLTPTDPILPKYTEAEIQKIIEARTTKKQREDALRTHPIEPKDITNRNDLCICGSGKKYKKCCGK